MHEFARLMHTIQAEAVGLMYRPLRLLRRHLPRKRWRKRDSRPKGRGETARLLLINPWYTVYHDDIPPRHSGPRLPGRR
jgi:hypothetical protein